MTSSASLAFQGCTPDLLDRYDRPVPRYTSYPPVPVWDRTFGPADYRSVLTRLDPSGEASRFSLYVHLPFCPVRCLYCGCNVQVTRKRERIDGYLDRLEREIDLVLADLGREQRVTQIHVGGGTPNFLTEAQLDRLMGVLDSRFRIGTDADTSIEADPRHATPEQLRQLRAIGFRRISFGVQDLDPGVQAAIGRLQPHPTVVAAVEGARAAGFDGVNVDLIYGLAGQTPEGFEATVGAVADLGPDRIACFGYAHVPTMLPHQRALERHHLPDSRERWALNRIAIERLTGAGYEWIGFDHFARPTDELARAAAERRLYRNFNGYTTLPADHLLGFGMSAISAVGGHLIQNHGGLEEWQRAVDGGALPVSRGHAVTADDRVRGGAIQRLMCELELPDDFGGASLAGCMARLREFAADGLVAAEPAAIRVTPRGRLFLRTICSVFDAYLPDPSAARPMARAV
jgi:oxygen-independent coproporphyrinogen-3 oxidase